MQDKEPVLVDSVSVAAAAAPDSCHEKAPDSSVFPEMKETAVMKIDDANGDGSGNGSDNNNGNPPETKPPYVFNEQTNYVPKRVIITVSRSNLCP
jgi:hypothetical protein